MSNREFEKHYERYCLGALDHPYPFYHALRSRDPVHRSERLNAWLLTRYSDAVFALREPRLSARKVQYLTGGLPGENRQRFEPLRNYLGQHLIQRDPPDHTRIRTFMQPAFSPGVIEGLRPFIADVAEALLRQAGEGADVDLVADFVQPLPLRVLCEVLGVPPDDSEQLSRWATAIVRFSASVPPTEGVAERAQDSLLKLREYLSNVIEQRRNQPADGLIDQLLARRDEGQQVSPAELLAQLAQLIVAGHDTTTGLIGNAVLALLENPDQAQILRQDPSLGPIAVDEFLRYDTSVQRMGRVATEDLELDGKTIRQGDTVLILLAAANHDPEQFHDPDRLDVRRAPNRHVGLGFGRHFCLGAPLARLECEVAVEKFLDFSQDGGAQIKDVEWKPGVTRNLESLVITFT